MQQLGNKQYQPKRLEYWLGGEGGGGDSEGKGDVVNWVTMNNNDYWGLSSHLPPKHTNVEELQCIFKMQSSLQMIYLANIIVKSHIITILALGMSASENY